MTKIENESQYEWAVERVEKLLPLVNDETPETDPNYIELVLLSNLVADRKKFAARLLYSVFSAQKSSFILDNRIMFVILQ